jgi:hypothetical protein
MRVVVSSEGRKKDLLVSVLRWSLCDGRKLIMTLETAGKLPNGIPIAEVDGSIKTVSVILPPGWKLQVMPSNSGAKLRDGRTSPLRTFDCVQVSAPPEIVKPR